MTAVPAGPAGPPAQPEGLTTIEPVRLPRSAIFADAVVIARRNLTRIARTPQLLVFATIQPIMFVLLFRYVFGGAIHVPGISYVDFLIPGIIVQTVVFGATSTAVGLSEDMSKGIIDRFRSLPMSRSAVLAGRTIADLVRNVFVVLLMIVVGTAVGFRFHNGLLPAVAAVFVALLLGYALSWVFALIGLTVADPETAQLAGFLPIFPLVFASSVFTSTQSMPGWLQAFANVQPITRDPGRLRPPGGPSLPQGLAPPGAGSTRGRGKGFVRPEIMISERPAEAEDRAVPGHREGDLILGLNSSAIGTLVERTTRFTMLLHLPPMEGHGGPRAKNGPALAGHGAEAVRDAIAASITTLPGQLRRSLTGGPGRRDGQPRATAHRHGSRYLLLRPAQPLAARQQREHQRTPAPVLPEGNRPQPAQRRRPRRSCRGTQRPPPQDTRLEDPTQSLEGDVEATRQVLDELDGDVVWSARTTAARSSPRPGRTRVSALVYVAAFAPDKGE